MNDSKRIVFIDYIRVVACFLVMLVHASETFYAADSSGLAGAVSMLANESNRFWVALYDGALGRVSVPLFMIVSAYLLVPVREGQSMGEFYRRRFMRILPPMVVFMLLYIVLPPLWGAITWEQALADLVHLPLTFPSMAGHLWFMYPLISLYLIIPVISPWIERATARELRMFLFLFLLSTLVPWLSRFAGSDIWGTCFWNPYFGMLYYCSGYLGYLVLAYYIRVHLHWSVRHRIAIGLLCFLSGAAFTGWAFWYVGVPGKVVATPMLEWSWEFCTPNVLLSTFGIFLLFSCIRGGGLASRWIGSVSRLTFGMYLMHLFFLSNITPFLVGDDVANPTIPVSIAIPAIASATFLCSMLTTKILSLLPGSRWIVG